MVNKTWYKGLWMELKKLAKKIDNSQADTDSLSDESISDEKQKILQTGQKRSFDTRTTRMPSDSRNELFKHFVPNENLAFPCSEGVEVKIESWDRVKYRKIGPSVQTCMILDSDCVYKNPLTPDVSSHVSTPNQIEKVQSEDIAGTKTASQIRELLLHKEKQQAERLKVQMKVDRMLEILKDSENKDNDIKELQDNEGTLKFLLNRKMKQIKKFVAFTLLIKECIKQLENPADLTDLSLLKKILKFNTQQINGRHGLSLNPWKFLLISITSTVKSIQMLTKKGETETDIIGYISKSKLYANKKIVLDPLVIKIADEKWSNYKLTEINLYRNVMRNETFRMMTSIAMVVTVAKHLFGLERIQIFLKLLNDGLFHFGSAGAYSDFVPNMSESAVRQNVTSFFEHVSDIMNRLMTLLLSCPDSKRLEQMPEQQFISLLQSVFSNSSLIPNTKQGERLSLTEIRGIRFTMVDSEVFGRALGDEMGEEIPDDLLDRLGQEMIVHSFVDIRLERTGSSERRENRISYCIFFPSDCRLFIYIPTEKGSYWHQLDILRAIRVNQHNLIMHPWSSSGIKSITERIETGKIFHLLCCYIYSFSVMN